MHYIIDKEAADIVGEAHTSKKSVNEAFGKMPLEEREKCSIVSGAADLVELSSAKLVELHNNSVEEESQEVKSFKKKAEAAEKTFAAMEAMHNPKAKKGADAGAGSGEPRAARGPREGSKIGKLVARLQEGKCTIEELSEASGYDLQNTRTAIGILRSKKQMAIEYDRETKFYKLAA